MVDHISKLRGLQNELHAMENLVTDEDFVMIIITSLPESWDNFTGSFLGASGNKTTIPSHELIARLLDEDRRRKGRIGGGAGMTLLSKGKDRKGINKDKECYNCKKTGHISSECWAKGGGKEGQGPKGRKGTGKRNRAHQAKEVNSSLNDACFMAGNLQDSSKYDWLLDSCTTSHVCPIQDAFTDFRPVKEILHGIGDTGAEVLGRGTVRIKFEFDGKIFIHQLRDTLYVPSAPNCLMSLSRIDDGGGSVDFKDGLCWIKSGNKTIGKGYKKQRLYMLHARAILMEKETANYASTEKLTWDQWHR